MTLKACLEEQVGRLVHPAAHASAKVVARHRLFIETRLAVSFGALSLVPVSLASGLVPSPIAALVMIWLLLPLVAVALLSAGGNIRQADTISLVTWIGLAFTLVLGGLAGPLTAAMLVLLVPFEAGLATGGPRLARAGIVALFATAGLWFAATLRSGGTMSTAEPFFVVLAIGYGVLLWRMSPNDGDVDGEVSRKTLAGLQTVFDAVDDLMIRFDRDGATPVNGGVAQDLFGLDPADISGRALFERVHVADRPAFLKLVSDGSHGHKTVTGRFRLRVGTRSGTGRPSPEPVFATIDMRVRPLSADGSREAPDGFAAFATLRPVDDVEPQHTDARQQDQENGAWRDRFLATVSHELRTPLNAIIGFSEMLASETLSPAQPEKRREYAEIIQASGQHLLAVVNSMLDLSKIDAGKFELSPESFEVAALLASCCDMMRLKAEQARIDLVWSVEPSALAIVGDKRACRQILLNLLSNALKFTPEYGRAAVEARLEGGMLALVVTDTGIGILAPDLARLGDPFFQAQNAYDRRFDGTGLGLSVVSGLVGLHGGTIVAESAPGEGTRITIRLPQEGGGTVGQIGGKAKIVTIPRSPRSVGSIETAGAKVRKIA